MTSEELNDIKRLVFRLNNNIFQEELFTFDCKDGDYHTLVFRIRSYEFVNDEKLFNNTCKQRVLQYKTNQKNTVSRKDVMLLSFFKQISVI